MRIKYLFTIVIAVTASNMLTGCKENLSANSSQNIFYTTTHQADSFGFNREVFQQLQTVFKQKKPDDFESAFYYYNYSCGYYYINTKDKATALLYADSMLLLTRDKANPAISQASIAIANLSEGDILFALKRYNEACYYYYNGKIAAEKSGDPYMLSEYNYRLGMAMYRKENYSAAAGYFKDAFEQGGYRNNSFSDFYRRQEVLDNAALSYLQSGKSDSAVWYCNKGLRFIADNEAKYNAGKKDLMLIAQGVLYGTIGRAYLQLHDTAGEGLLQKSIAVNSLPGNDNGNALEMQTCLARFYLDTAFPLQLKSAYTTLIAIQRGLDTVRNNDAVAVQWNELMSRYYALQGNKGEAYTYLVRYNVLHQQQMDANRMLAETNISGHLKMLQSQYELSLLKTNDQLKTIYLQIAVGLCLVTGFILFLAIRHWNKAKKNGRALTALNKQVEQQKLQLETTVKLLNQQVKTKDYILCVLAHDLRNPISAISTLTRIVRKEYENEADNKEFLDMAQSACKDTLTMIDSIMQLSQQGRPETMQRCIFDVNEVVKDSVELLRFKAEAKHQEIVLHTAGTPQYTLADADKINRVLSNLLMNAIKFSFPKSTIEVYVKDKEDSVEIEVKDEGIGIPAALQDKVFDVFTEAKRKGTAKEGTFGLGLSICKQLIEAHNGTIWFESKEGLGSAFYVQLHKHLLSKHELEYEAYEAEEV